MPKRKKPPRQWRQPEQLDPGLRLAVEAAGGRMYKLAKLLRIAPQAVSQWNRIPMARVLDVERVTKVDRERLRPDIYRRRRAS